MAGMKHAALAIWSPKDRRPIPDWAAENFWCVYPLAIRNCFFQVRDSRHFVAPLEALSSIAKSEISVRAPCRSGKTLIGEVFVASTTCRDPGPTMWVSEKDSLADQEWDRMEALFEASPAIAARLPQKTPQGSRRDKGTGEVPIIGGALYIHGAAVSNLQQKGIRYIIMDEVWNWRPGRMDEAFGRIGDYLKLGTSKVLIISQGGIDGEDWDRYYRRGSCCEWEVQCLGCGQYFRPEWTHDRADGSKAGMRWDEKKDEDGFWIPSACLASVRYECPLCGYPHTDTAKTKAEWNRTGRYVQTNHDARPERESFHWTNIIDFPWVELVDIFLQSVNAMKQGNTDPLITFFQKHMAENRSEHSLMQAVVNFVRTSYDIRSKWSDELARFMTVDVQETHYWGTIRQWAKDGRSRRLWCGRLTSYADIENRREEFKVKARLTALDSGHRAKGDSGVYAACVRYGWLALKGDAERTFWHVEGESRVEHSFSEPAWGDPEIGTAGAGMGQKAPLIRFSSDSMADRLDGLIAKGRWEEPIDDGSPAELEYKRQMSAEVKKEFEDPRTHRTFFRRILIHRDNHYFDCGKMQVTMATLAGILPDLTSETKNTTP